MNAATNNAPEDGKLLFENLQIIFQCKLCKFNTIERNAYIKHCRTNHLSAGELQAKSSPITPTNYIPKIESTSTTTNDVKERFLCSLCYNVFINREHVKEHMIRDHDYEPIKTKNEDENADVSPADEKSNEKASVLNEEEAIIAADMKLRKEWLDKPISLKALRVKLKKSFIYTCSFSRCLYSFESLDKKNYHEKCHASVSHEKSCQFKCAECQYELKNWRNCSSHLWKEHSIDIDLLKCPFCNYKVGVTVQVFRHLQSHGTTKGYACSECPKIFKQYSLLRCHRTTHSDSDELVAQNRWYSQKKCTICGNVFSNSKILSKHIKAVHNKIKPFICNICGHKSARKSSWIVHMRQHTGDKPILCKYCEFKAADPSVVKKHELRHFKSSAFPYKCPDCKYVSAQSATYKTHLRKYHPNSYRAIICDFDKCNYVSVNADNLKRHKQAHTLLLNDDSNNGDAFKEPHKTVYDKPNVNNVEISSDCFLPVESTDSIAHDPPLDTGGVTIPAHHSEETQFPSF